MRTPANRVVGRKSVAPLVFVCCELYFYASNISLYYRNSYHKLQSELDSLSAHGMVQGSVLVERVACSVNWIYVSSKVRSKNLFI